MRVAKRSDAYSGHQVQVFAAIDVVETRAAAANERDRLPLVSLDNVPLFEPLDVVQRQLVHRTTCVHPASGPLAAPSASSSTSRPFAITTSPTPWRRAARHASSFATIPLFAVPDLIKRAACRESSRSIVRPVSSSTPDVPPAITSRRAASDAARCAASVSALTLSNWPSRVEPIHATTGTYPRARRSVSSCGEPL